MKLLSGKPVKLDFKKLYEAERSHWWFRSRREIVSHLFWGLYNKKLDKNLNILSVGSSTGAEIEYLAKYGVVTGIDLDEELIEYCRIKGLNILKNDIIDCSFPDESYDIIFAMDILEHVHDHKKAYCEIYRMLKKGGYLIITVPACQFLWSKHDELGAYPHKRRYNRENLLKLLNSKKIKILKLSYYNFFLFPLIFVIRKLKVFTEAQLEIPNKFMNTFLKLIFSSEKYFLNKVNFPIGVSLVAICRKL